MRRTFQVAFVPHVAFVLPIETNSRPHLQPLISHGAYCGRSCASAPQTARTRAGSHRRAASHNPRTAPSGSPRTPPRGPLAARRVVLCVAGLCGAGGRVPGGGRAQQGTVAPLGADASTGNPLNGLQTMWKIW